MWGGSYWQSGTCTDIDIHLGKTSLLVYKFGQVDFACPEENFQVKQWRPPPRSSNQQSHHPTWEQELLALFLTLNEWSHY